MKKGSGSSLIAGDASEVFSECEMLQQAQPATVPVVVLGGSLGGLAAAVAIRTRTGRAVCVLDIQQQHEQQHDQHQQQQQQHDQQQQQKREEEPCLLTARCMDALRAINSELYRAVIAATRANESSILSPFSPCSLTGESPMRLPAAALKQLLLEHLTRASGGGISYLWGCRQLQQIWGEEQQQPNANNEEQKLFLGFEGGVVIQTNLLVVASNDFGVTHLLGVQEGSELQKSSELNFSLGCRQQSNAEGSLLGEAEQRFASSLGSTTTSTVTGSDSPATDTSSIMEGKGEGACEDSLTTRSTTSLSAFLDGIRKRGIEMRGAEASWVFMDGRVVLTAAAAHPWASALSDGLELDMEDAAQLGCSLYDWRFKVLNAASRYEAVRQRRLAALIKSPRMSRSWVSGEEICDTSTAASPSPFSAAEEVFLPARDAYAELLPAQALAFDLQEIALQTPTLR